MKNFEEYLKKGLVKTRKENVAIYLSHYKNLFK